MLSPSQEKDRSDKAHFDMVADVVVRRFNEAGIAYGTSAIIGYPVRMDDVFMKPMRGGAAYMASNHCRCILAYILRYHIPIWDSLLMEYRLATMAQIGAYLGGRSHRMALNMAASGCRYIHDERFRKVYSGTMLQLASDGVEVWSAPKNIRDCA